MGKIIWEIYRVMEETEDDLIPAFNMEGNHGEFLTRSKADEERIYLQPDHDNILVVVKETQIKL